MAVNIQTYLAHRRRYEVLITLFVVGLLVTLNATSKIIENLRDGLPSGWQAAWIDEGSSGLAVLVLIPLLVRFLSHLNLSFANLRWRAGWLVVGFFVFSLLHIAMFSALRWLVLESYEFGSVGLRLLYEMRKDLLTYVLVVVAIYAYQFILDRLQGEARFLAEGADQSDEAVDRLVSSRQRTQFLVKMLNREYLVRVDEIDWVESAGNYVLMHCGGRSYPMRSTLAGLAEELDQQQFLRTHRTAIVNLERVESLTGSGDMKVELTTGDVVPVSRTYLPQVRGALAS